MTALQKMPETEVVDDALVTDGKVRQAVSAMDGLGDWLVRHHHESRSLTNAQQRDLERAYNRVRILLGMDTK
jgi:hypothetical protein